MWDAFKDAIFWCIDAAYGFVADWGLAIILVTLILRLILFPLMQKQIRSSYRMQQFTPRIQEIQEKGSRTEGMTYSFYNILPSLLSSPSSMLDQGFMAFLPYGILLLLFAFCTFLPSLLQQMGTNSPQKTQTMIMMGIMSLFMMWLGWGSPTGVLLFWATSSVFGVLQQVISTKLMKHKDEEIEAEKVEVKPVEVNVVRKEKKKRPHKKSKK